MRQVDVTGVFEALKTKGEARLSDFATPIEEKNEETGIDYNQFQPIEDMNEVTPIFKKIFDGGKTYGTDSVKMGFYKESPMIAKVDGNTIEFALPFNGAMAMLKEFLKKAHHLRGARNAADALPWVLDRARSPQEIDLALTFCLPKRLGGHGFKKPQLNHPISITGAARKINSDHTDEIDVYWEDQHFGFEYNSYSDHGDPRKIGKDERRALSLHAIGEHVRFVTDEQLKDPHQVAMLAHILEEYGVPHVC